MTEYVELDANTLETTDRYRLIIGCVVPRPIAWVTTVNAKGVVNAAPFSAYNYVSHSPPLLAINIGERNGQLKDTARNIRDTGEFTVNVVTESVMELMHACGADYTPDESEAEALDIAMLPSSKVRSPRIAASPIHMECKLVQAVTLGKSLSALYIGEIVAFHLSTDVYDGRHVDSVKLRPLARLGGPFYAGLGEIWNRPALQKPPGAK